MFENEAPSTLFYAKFGKFKNLREERTRCKSGLIASISKPGDALDVEVWIRDITGRGLGFTVSHQLAIGDRLEIKIKKHAVVPSMRFDALVVHCTQESDCCWHIGCELTEGLPTALVEYLSR